MNPESQQNDEKLIEELSKLHLLQEDISTEQSLIQELNQRSFFERYEIQKEKRVANQKFDSVIPGAKAKI